MPNKQVCIDASVALKLVVDEEDSGRARKLWKTWARGAIGAVAAPLFPFECVSALRRMVVRGDLDAAAAAVARDHLLRMPVRLVAPPTLFTRAWELAAELERPQAYDSFYLATADLLGVELWTANTRFHNAAAGRYGCARCANRTDGGGRAPRARRS